MKQSEMVKRLKLLIIFTALIGAVFLFVIVPKIGAAIAQSNSRFEYLLKPGIFLIWLTAVPVYISLYKVWKICGEISENNSFSEINAKYLSEISGLSVLDGAAYFVLIMLLLITNHIDVIVIICLLVAVFIAFFVAVVTAMLSHLTKKASQLKRENDLTI